MERELGSEEEQEVTKLLHSIYSMYVTESRISYEYVLVRDQKITISGFRLFLDEGR